MPDLAELTLAIKSDGALTADQRMQSMTKAAKAAEDQSAKLAAATQAASGAGSNHVGVLDRIANGYMKLQAVMGAFVAGAGAVGLVLKAIQSYAHFEQTEIAFTTLMQSASEAKKMLLDLEHFSDETPFEFNGIADASKHLLAFGYEAKEIMPIMRILGDTVSAFGGGNEMLARMAETFGKIKTEGKLSGIEVKSLAMEGIPVWKMIADQIGTTVDVAKTRVERGLIDADTATALLLRGMAAKYEGQTQKSSESLLGLWSTFKTRLDNAFRDTGKVLAESLDIRGFEKKMISGITTVGHVVADVVQIFAGLPTSFKDSEASALKFAQGLKLVFDIVAALVALKLVGFILQMSFSFLQTAGTCLTFAGSLSQVYQKVTIAATGFGVLLAAVAALSVVFLAFEFGTWLYDNFKEVQNASASVVMGIQKVWNVAVYGMKLLLIELKASWESLKATLTTGQSTFKQDTLRSIGLGPTDAEVRHADEIEQTPMRVRSGALGQADAFFSAHKGTFDIAFTKTPLPLDASQAPDPIAGVKAEMDKAKADLDAANLLATTVRDQTQADIAAAFKGGRSQTNLTDQVGNQLAGLKGKINTALGDLPKMFKLPELHNQTADELQKEIDKQKELLNGKKQEGDEHKKIINYVDNEIEHFETERLTLGMSSTQLGIHKELLKAKIALTSEHNKDIDGELQRLEKALVLQEKIKLLTDLSKSLNSRQYDAQLSSLSGPALQNEVEVRAELKKFREEGISLDQKDIDYVRQIVVQTNRLKESWAEVHKIGDAVGTAFESVVTGLIDGAKRWQDVLLSAIKQVESAILSSMLKPLTQSISSGSSSFLGSLLGLSSTVLPPAQASGAPAVMAEQHASGMVIDSPTMFSMGGRMHRAGENGPEGLFPLSRGANGKLGLASGGSGGSTTNVYMTVNTPDAGSFRASDRQIASAIKRKL